ncbi:SKP1-like protein 14 [Linum grandiflorum]
MVITSAASASSSTATPNLLELQTSDGQTFEITEPLASKSIVLKRMTELVDCSIGVVVIPLSEKVTGKAMAKVVEYCGRHPTGWNRRDWELKLVKELDQITLFGVLTAAYYFEMKGLVDLGAELVAEMLKGVSPAEVSKVFNIKGRWWPEEEDELRRKYPEFYK